MRHFLRNVDIIRACRTLIVVLFTRWLKCVPVVAQALPHVFVRKSLRNLVAMISSNKECTIDIAILRQLYLNSVQKVSTSALSLARAKDKIYLQERKRDWPARGHSGLLFLIREGAKENGTKSGDEGQKL